MTRDNDTSSTTALCVPVPRRDGESLGDIALSPAEFTVLPNHTVHTKNIKSTVFDLYSVGANEARPTKPFICTIRLHSSLHPPVDLPALFDDGAMISALSYSKYLHWLTY